MFWGMVMYNNEFKTKGNQVLIKGKKLNHNVYSMYCEHESNLSCFPFPLAVGEETCRLFSVIMTATTYILGASKLDSSLDLPISRRPRSVNSKWAHFVVREDS